MNASSENQSAQDEVACKLDATTSPNGTRELRLVRDGVPMRLWVVAVIGFWERAAFWGLTAPWQNYMQHCPFSGPEHPSGALCLGQATATRAYCAFYIFYYISPLLVAVVSDTFLGRYKTLCISVFLFNCGCAALTITSLPRYIFEGWGVLGLILAMGLIGLGGGGFRAVMVPFIADQYVESPPTLKTLKSGEQVVTNRALTLQYIYNLFYWVGNLGSLSWFATVFIENRYGFTLAYLITWVFMFIAMMMLFAGGKWYVKIPLEGNVLPKATKIMLCASKHRFKMERAEPAYQLEHYNRTVAWSSRLVNELTRGLKACRVLLAFIVFYVCFDQMQNNLVSQAGQMKTYDIPNDMMPAMNQVACILLGPIIQEGLYPFLHRRKIYIQPITRITIGFAFVSLSMLYATVVQHFVYSARPCYEHAGECPAMGPQFRPNEINVWIQTPIYFLIAAGEIFAYVTGLEFAYDHSPKDMKAIIQAVNLLLAGIGSMFALALTPIAHNPYLIILYACLTAAMTVTTIAFWLIFRKYDQTRPCEMNVNDTSDGGADPDLEEAQTFTDERGASILRLKPRTMSPNPAYVTVIGGGDGQRPSLSYRRSTGQDPTSRTRSNVGIAGNESSNVPNKHNHQHSADPQVPPSDNGNSPRRRSTMMSGALHPQISNHCEDLFESPRKAPSIPSSRVSNELLTPTSPKLVCDNSLEEVPEEVAEEAPTPKDSLNRAASSRDSAKESRAPSLYETAYEHMVSVKQDANPEPDRPAGGVEPTDYSDSVNVESAQDPSPDISSSSSAAWPLVNPSIQQRRREPSELKMTIVAEAAQHVRNILSVADGTTVAPRTTSTTSAPAPAST